MLKIQKVTDAAFRPYGRVISGYDLAELEAAMQHMPVPEGVGYEPSIPELEAVKLFPVIRDQIYGGMPIQFGYCTGNNDRLNALEYHRDSELNIAFTDIALLLGLEKDIDPDTFEYDTSKVEAFAVPKGAVVELYATTLHYAPVGRNFRVCCVLPKGTNEPLRFQPAKEGEPKLLLAANKWLIAHAEGGVDGGYVGLKGENHRIEM